MSISAILLSAPVASPELKPSIYPFDSAISPFLSHSAVLTADKYLKQGYACIRYDLVAGFGRASSLIPNQSPIST